MAGTHKRGAFIVFEGIDRVGKSTQCQRLVDFLNKEGQKAELFRFPDRTTEIGKRIDAYLQNKANLNDRMIHLLFSLNRHECSRKLIETLEAGTTIVCDRYCFSGAAYTMAKSSDAEEFTYEWCIMPDVGLPQPDVVVFLDMPVSEAMKRADFGGERYEKKDFQERIRGNFHYIKARTENYGPEWKAVDARMEMDAITEAITKNVGPVVKQVESTPVKLLTQASLLPNNPVDPPKPMSEEPEPDKASEEPAGTAAEKGDLEMKEAEAVPQKAKEAQEVPKDEAASEQPVKIADKPKADVEAEQAKPEGAVGGGEEQKPVVPSKRPLADPAAGNVEKKVCV